MELDALPGVLQPGQRWNLAPGNASLGIEVLQTATRQPMPLQEASHDNHDRPFRFCKDGAT
jgi:hypothetical protein